MTPTNRPHRITLEIISILVVLLLLWGCGGDADRPPSYEQFEGDIVSAHAAQLETITYFLDNATAGAEGYALRSTHHEDAWWVATPTLVDGEEQGMGVWLCGGAKEDPSTCIAASGFATNYTGGSNLRDTEAWSTQMLTPMVALRDYANDQTSTSP